MTEEELKQYCERQSEYYKIYYEHNKEIIKEKLKKRCEILKNVLSNVKNPESLFSDIEFVRELTGCKIPTKKKNLKKSRK